MAKTKHPKSLFGRRLREARQDFGIAQDKLGVMIGLDESCSSARMSRYENGIHAPAFETSERIAEALKLPTAYFYCSDDMLAEIIKIYFGISKDARLSLYDFSRDLTLNFKRESNILG
jgi:transcriptional regulator with XRE-family HTH domain